MADKFEIDVKAFAKTLQSGQDLNGKNGLLAPLIKQVTEAALEAEVDEHLVQKEAANRKNGSSRKTVKTSSGPFQLDTPRDQNGPFEPQKVKKYQTRLTDEMERKIISLFTLGNIYQNIREHLTNLYGLEVSNDTINPITDR